MQGTNINDYKVVYVCEDTVDGIFTAIYKAWENGISKTMVEVRDCSTMSFLYEYIDVKTDTCLSFKVAETIQKKLSGEVYSYIFQTALSDNCDKAQLIYQFLIKAFKMGPSILQYLQDEDVSSIFKISRRVSNEAHKYLGFVRFEELENGVLIARINPLSNVIPLIAEHFCDRLLNENWVILDTRRNYSAIHKRGLGFVLSDAITEKDLLLFSKKSMQEELYKSLWENFFQTIAIKERENFNLQRNMMPLRYRKYM